MGWAAFSDLWGNAGMAHRLGLCGIFVGSAAMPVVGVMSMVGGLGWLAAALWVGAVVLIVLANYERVKAIKRYRTDWYPNALVASRSSKVKIREDRRDRGKCNGKAENKPGITESAE
jgi:hypothetical protein